MPKSTRGSDHNNQNAQVSYHQMALPLEEVLEAHLGEFIPLDIGVDDIGGELLSILSTGLYTNPLDCIREYVQNAVDANAHAATIKITGNSVHVFDDGDGMLLGDLLQARQFGVSMKSLTLHVGFRGIGIYSSFHLCNQLRVTSKRAGSNHQHMLVFEFGEMKAQLERDKRKAPNERKTSLVELLSKHTKVCRDQQTLAQHTHFTHVEMQEISDVHIKELANREELHHYMIRNLPIDFDPLFEYKEQINQQLNMEVPGYNAITLTLQTDGQPDLVVTKPAIPHLQAPIMGSIVSRTGKNARKVAYYWACLNAERDRIAQNARFLPEVRDNRELQKAMTDEFRAYEGFVYKMKGFTIGNRDRLRHFFASKMQLYPWYTGEIYVLDTTIIPKADRDDFETNEAKRVLDLAVMNELSDLEDKAEKFQATGVADERVEKYQIEIALIEHEIDANIQGSDFKTYTRLNEILKDLRRQEKKASSDKRAVARTIVKNAERLQKRLEKETETAQSEVTRRKRAAQEEKPLLPVQHTFTENQESSLDESSKLTLPTPTKVVPLPETPLVLSPEDNMIPTTPASIYDKQQQVSIPPVAAPFSSRTLEQIVIEAGWHPEGECMQLLVLLQASIENVLLDITTYNSILADFEDRLNNDVRVSN